MAIKPFLGQVTHSTPA
jgi:hypothetical protein